MRVRAACRNLHNIHCVALLVLPFQPLTLSEMTAEPLPDELYADPDELHDLSLARGMTYSVWSSELGSNAMDVERMARMPDQGNPAATAVASVRLSARVPPGRPMQVSILATQTTDFSCRMMMFARG